jgi:hypothetical protein
MSKKNRGKRKYHEINEDVGQLYNLHIENNIIPEYEDYTEEIRRDSVRLENFFQYLKNYIHTFDKARLESLELSLVRLQENATPGSNELLFYIKSIINSTEEHGMPFNVFSKKYHLEDSKKISHSEPKWKVSTLSEPIFKRNKPKWQVSTLSEPIFKRNKPKWRTSAKKYSRTDKASKSQKWDTSTKKRSNKSVKTAWASHSPNFDYTQKRRRTSYK